MGNGYIYNIKVICSVDVAFYVEMEGSVCPRLSLTYPSSVRPSSMKSHISLQSHSDDCVSLGGVDKSRICNWTCQHNFFHFVGVVKTENRSILSSTNFWNWSKILISRHTIVNEPVLKTFDLLLTFIYSMPFFIREVISMFSLHKSVLFLIRQNNYYLDTELIDLETSHNNSQNFPALKQ